MNIKSFALLGIVLLGLVSWVSAQNSLPNPNDDNCWSSLTALRACQIQAYDEAQDYAQRCTSYPEYQCNDYYQPPQKAAAKASPKADAKSTRTTPSSTAASPQGTSDNVDATSSAN